MNVCWDTFALYIILHYYVSIRFHAINFLRNAITLYFFWLMAFTHIALMNLMQRRMKKRNNNKNFPLSFFLLCVGWKMNVDLADARMCLYMLMCFTKHFLISHSFLSVSPIQCRGKLFVV